MKLWHDTYENSRILINSLASTIEVYSAIADDGKAGATLALHIHTAGDMSASTRANLNPDQMRALAAHLHQHADQLEQLQAQAATLPLPMAEAA